MEARLTAQAAELTRSNTALEEFAYIASHDLKEPLRGIHNYATFLKEDYGERLDEAGRDKLDTLLRLSRRMNDLIEALLEYSRAGRTEAAVGPTRIEPTVQDVLETMAPLVAEHAVDVRVHSPLPRVVCDSVRVAEVFRNLLTNAIKYRSPRPPVIEIGCQPAQAPSSDALPSARWPIFFVRDNGIGIAQEHFATIFRMFKRLHPRDAYGGGVGAGLAIVEKIIARMGGTIRVESALGQGTTFYFTVGPLAEQIECSAEPVPAAPEPAPDGAALTPDPSVLRADAERGLSSTSRLLDRPLRVLVVDDDESLLEHLERGLCSRHERWQMRFLNDPERALSSVSEETVDVILSDLNMPGLAGDSLLEQVRQRSPQTLRILMSSEADLTTVLRSIGPSHRFLAKPCSPEEVEDVIRSAWAIRDYLRDSLLPGVIGRIAKGPLFPRGSGELLEPTREVLRDGLRGAQHLAARLLEQFRVGTAQGIDVNEFWRRASHAAHCADRICSRQSATPVLRSHAVLAALLHELGVLILARYAPDLLQRAEQLVREADLSREDAERATFHATQDDVGAYALGLWGFPDPIVEAVAFQRRPALSCSSGFAAVSVVHVARALAHAQPRRGGEAIELAGIDRAYFDRLGLAHRLQPWLECCTE